MFRQCVAFALVFTSLQTFADSGIEPWIESGKEAIAQFMGWEQPLIENSSLYAATCAEVSAALDGAIPMESRPYQNKIDRPHYELKVRTLVRMGAEGYQSALREENFDLREAKIQNSQFFARSMDYLRVAPPALTEELAALWKDRTLSNEEKQKTTLGKLKDLGKSVTLLRKLERTLLNLAKKRPIDADVICKYQAMMKLLGEMVGPVARANMMVPSPYSPIFPGSYLLYSIESVIAASGSGLSRPDQVYARLGTLADEIDEKKQKLSDRRGMIAGKLEANLTEIRTAQQYIEELKKAVNVGSDSGEQLSGIGTHSGNDSETK